MRLGVNFAENGLFTKPVTDQISISNMEIVCGQKEILRKSLTVNGFTIKQREAELKKTDAHRV